MYIQVITLTEPQTFYTIKETAQFLGVNQQKIFNLLRSGEQVFPNAKKVGWQWLIPVADVEAYKRNIENIK